MTTHSINTKCMNPQCEEYDKTWCHRLHTVVYATRVDVCNSVIYCGKCGHKKRITKYSGRDGDYDTYVEIDWTDPNNPQDVLVLGLPKRLEDIYGEERHKQYMEDWLNYLDWLEEGIRFIRATGHTWTRKELDKYKQW